MRKGIKTTSSVAVPKPSHIPQQEEIGKLDNLMEAAAQVFLEFGYEAASTSEIARRAHTSKQTIYAHFSNKEKLFFAVLERRFSQVSDIFSAMLYEDQPLPSLLLELGRAFRSVMLHPEHVALIRLVYLESTRFPGIAETFVRSGPDKGRQRLSAFFREKGAQGRLNVPDPQLAAQHFLALILGDAVNRALLRLPISTSHQAEQLRMERSVNCFLKAYEN